jgi:hypothetical protein
MELSIIIVNWKTRDYVAACIRSIQRDAALPDYEIIVVDNASEDGCEEMLQREFARVKFVQAGANLGFAGANNLGVRQAKGLALLFLNPDTLIQDGAIAKLLARLHSLPRAGAVGARLLNTDLSFQTSCIKAYPTILNQLLASEALQRRFPRWKIWGMAAGFGSLSEPAEVEVVSGACILMKREVFEKIGGFNEKYFMYSEDVDLCLMCRRSGLRNYYVPDALIVHHGGGGSSQAGASDFSTVMFEESRYQYFRRNKGAVYALAYRFFVTMASVARLGLIAFAFLLPREPDARKRLSGSRRKWSSVMAWALGRKKACRAA